MSKSRDLADRPNDITVDSSGNVGIGTSNPSSKLHVYSSSGNTYSLLETGGASNAGQRFKNSLREWYVFNNASGALDFYDATSVASRMSLGMTGQLFTTIEGTTGVRADYGCRAWVNFNGTGTISTRASGNVSSITDNATGQYTISFSSAMPDANYSAVAANDNGEYICFFGSYQTGQVQVRNYNPDGNAYVDTPIINVAIIR